MDQLNVSGVPIRLIPRLVRARDATMLMSTGTSLRFSGPGQEARDFR